MRLHILTPTERIVKFVTRDIFEFTIITMAAIVMGIAALSLYWVIPAFMDWVDKD
jgi:hypothetical protein